MAEDLQNDEQQGIPIEAPPDVPQRRSQRTVRPPARLDDYVR